MNLFDKSKSKATGSTTKKAEKVIVKVDGTDFDQNLIRYAQLKAEMDAVKAKLEMVEADFKPACIDVFNEQYKKTGVNPDSFIITSKSGSSVMVIPSDKYIKPTEDTFTELTEKYNGEVTEEITEFSLDTELVQKYGDLISKAIEKIKDIPTDEKERLIKAKTVMTVKKGSIDKAITVGKGNISEYISDIRPVFGLKNAKVGENVK